VKIVGGQYDYGFPGWKMGMGLLMRKGWNLKPRVRVLVKVYYYRPKPRQGSTQTIKTERHCAYGVALFMIDDDLSILSSLCHFEIGSTLNQPGPEGPGD
jgi:hypothetical protein